MTKYTKEEILNTFDKLRDSIQSQYKTETDFWEKRWSNKKGSVSLVISDKDFVCLVMRKKG